MYYTPMFPERKYRRDKYHGGTLTGIRGVAWLAARHGHWRGRARRERERERSRRGRGTAQGESEHRFAPCLKENDERSARAARLPQALHDAKHHVIYTNPGSCHMNPCCCVHDKQPPIEKKERNGVISSSFDNFLKLRLLPDSHARGLTPRVRARFAKTNIAKNARFLETSHARSLATSRQVHVFVVSNICFSRQQHQGTSRGIKGQKWNNHGPRRSLLLHTPGK